MTVALFSCGKGSGSSSTTNTSSNWTFGQYTYSRGASSENNSNQFSVLVVSTTGNGGNYGAYSGSSLSILYNTLGPGQYTLVAEDTMIKYPSARYMCITCAIGTAVNTGSTLYEVPGITSATATLTQDGSEKFHVSLALPVNLIKTTEVNGGIAGAASSYALTINNAY